MTLIYIAYLAISIAVTIWVARTLSNNGKIFLVHAFSGNQALADSVNHLLVVGFYLVNVGYITKMIRNGILNSDAVTFASSLAVVSEKIGGVLFILGCMHFFNLYIFNKIRKSADLANIPAPVKPTIKIGV